MDATCEARSSFPWLFDIKAVCQAGRAKNKRLLNLAGKWIMTILQVMARCYLPSDDLTGAIAFYEQLLNMPCTLKFRLETYGLDIAAVGSVHLIAGDEKQLAPWRSITAAFFVDSVERYAIRLSELGSKIVLQPQQGPFGMFMVAELPGGLMAEFADSGARKEGLTDDSQASATRT